MTRRTFQYLGDEWEVTPTDTGHRVAASWLKPIEHRWGFVFRSLSNQKEYRNHVSARAPEAASQDALVQALEEALVIDAIESSRYVWRPAEAISRDTGIPLERVRRILNTTSRDVITAPQPNAQGFTLYSTRDHYQRLEPLVNRLLDNLHSSSTS